ncbi:HutD family protein [Pleionea sp. CnH1-48]|uniref:HutD/Ves family protein n=1 Tax=Pleionea sp. CnH1-48 TaxID=2954494 RepID=UPI002096C067|nr:HutD family protein [Pleionea sp. CnH1-48]MCO7224103.1 HutD family protein [Pleionea sp. CnH1-48]
MNVTAPHQYKSTPWKNGKGETIELAISPNSTLDNFDWRLSIATVAEDGAFSNFSGLERNLVLIEGNGLTLEHDEQSVDKLDTLLSYATFDGGSQTFGTLHNGTIRDFNIMHRPDKFAAIIETVTEQAELKMPSCDFGFVYPLTTDVEITYTQKESKETLLQGHLGQFNSVQKDNVLISGKSFILVCFIKR